MFHRKLSTIASAAGLVMTIAACSSGGATPSTVAKPANAASSDAMMP